MATLPLALLLAGCTGAPASNPVDWWHDLQGGIIAEHRPPPPGADLPYPNINLTPAKPVVPSAAYRLTISNTLTTQRDTAERNAADNPIQPVPVAPPPPPPPAPANPQAETASASIPAAEAPAPKPAPAATPPAAEPLRIAGALVSEPNLPEIPDAPPAPPSIVGAVAAQPAPTPRIITQAVEAPGGTAVFFATGSPTLDPGQNETLNDIAGSRRHGKISIEAHGDAASDSPQGQEDALKLALARAQAIATQLIKDGVPKDAILIAATPFTRGATLRVVP